MIVQHPYCGESHSLGIYCCVKSPVYAPQGHNFDRFMNVISRLDFYGHLAFGNICMLLFHLKTLIASLACQIVIFM